MLLFVGLGFVGGVVSALGVAGARAWFKARAEKVAEEARRIANQVKNLRE